MIAATPALMLSLASAADATRPGVPWFEVDPEGPAEQALCAAIERGPFAGPEGAIRALDAVAGAHAGSPVAGLARLAAGLLLAEAGRPQEALTHLLHQDVQRTALRDHASLGAARSREAARDHAGAATAYLAAAAMPESPQVCDALLGAARALVEAGQGPRAVETLNRSLHACPGQEPGVLLLLGRTHDSARAYREAAEAFDRLDRDHPASEQAREAGRRLQALAPWRPRLTAEAQARRNLSKALALFEGDRRRDSVLLLTRLLRAPGISGEEADLVRVRLGQALASTGQTRQARAQLSSVPPGSRHAAEAAYLKARLEPGDNCIPALAAVADTYPGTPWAAQALLALGNHFQKDSRDAEALPHYRRLLSDYPDGPHLERAAWYVGWSDYRAGRFAEAAQVLERTARLRPNGDFTSSFLYWAARALREVGRLDRSRELLEETVRRYKHSYYGVKAFEALGGPIQADPEKTLRPPISAAGSGIPEPQRTRLRQLVLIRRFGEARAELTGLAPSPAILATMAWLDHRRSRLRDAISEMRAAQPGSIGTAGDQLPQAVWEILYPLVHGETLRRNAALQGLDPALVAALVRQESTFDAGALSPAGARGLMQIMPATGRRLARSLGLRYSRSLLHDPAASLRLGTLYLRQMLDRFRGRVEQALAAYNAGPSRVEDWTAARPGLTEEEFIESIPFTETRSYVKSVLGARALYRRVYSLAGPDPAGPAPAGRP